MKLLITKGDTRLVGKILEPIFMEEMLYNCKINSIQLIDTWDEIHAILNYPDKKIKEFYCLHLFTNTLGDKLAFIESVKLI